MEPKLYIIMREDIQDMNPGKGMAQAAHAQADFDHYVDFRCGPEFTQTDDLWVQVSKWREDRNFGVTLVLSATLDQMTDITRNVMHCDLVTDPTYPWRNYYKQVFTTSEITCMWAFVYDEAELEYMSKYRLHS